MDAPRKIVIFLACCVIVGAAVIVATSCSSGAAPPQQQTRAEKKQELRDLLINEGLLEEAFRQSGLVNDGRYDLSLLPTELLGTDLADEVAQHLRVVQITTTLFLTEEQLIGLYQSDEIGQELLDLKTPEGLFPIGIRTFHVSGVLAGDLVITPATFSPDIKIIAESFAAGYERLEVTAILLPNTVQGEIAGEELFRGDFSGMLKGIVDSEYNLAFFKRPRERLVGGSPVNLYSNPVESSLVPQGAQLAVPVLASEDGVGLAPAWAVLSVSQKGQFAAWGAFSRGSQGLPVFITKDGKPIFAGMVIDVSTSINGLVIVRDSKSIADRITVLKRLYGQTFGVGVQQP